MTVKIIKIFNKLQPGDNITVDTIVNNIKYYKEEFKNKIKELKKKKVEKENVEKPHFNYKKPQRDEN